jgi:Uma2 family endonuclease
MTPPDAAVAAPKKLMTVDEYWDWCQLPDSAERRTELIRGEVVEVPFHTRREGVVITNVVMALGRYAEARGGYATMGSGVTLADRPGTVIGPDVAYFAGEITFDDAHAKWGREAPLLAVEVRSSDGHGRPFADRIAAYREGDVPTVWLVDCGKRSVSVWRLDERLPRIADESVVLTVPEMPEFSCHVNDLFRLPAERRRQTPADLPSA